MSNACSVVFPAVLSLEAEAKLCHYYETQLVEAHDECCTFRNEMKAYLRELTAEPPKRTIPLAFACILPVPQLQLLESPHPNHVFQKMCDSYVNHLQSRSQTLPVIKLPPNVDNFQNNDESTAANTLLSRIEATLATPADESIPASAMTIAIALVLFGWMPVNDEEDSDTTNDDASLIVRTECSFCLSTFSIHEPDVNDANNNKRRKTLSPFDAHSYYCPYVCGFQKQPPLWESLASKLLTEPETPNVETAYLKSHGILRSALSPKFRQPLHGSKDDGNDD
ncbi:hypothetical protein MPSEU_000842100 [Mayamaea pseudoterrestris]|nr:hypothetical protein MPSEU_000842100 [Mayamaea pseudoterrestris]